MTPQTHTEKQQPPLDERLKGFMVDCSDLAAEDLELGMQESQRVDAERAKDYDKHRVAILNADTNPALFNGVKVMRTIIDIASIALGIATAVVTANPAPLIHSFIAMTSLFATHAKSFSRWAEKHGLKQFQWLGTAVSIVGIVANLVPKSPMDIFKGATTLIKGAETVLGPVQLFSNVSYTLSEQSQQAAHAMLENKNRGSMARHANIYDYANRLVRFIQRATKKALQSQSSINSAYRNILVNFSKGK